MNTIVSIIIPCFNSKVTLEATLESVLRQKYQNWEAIIVNDGSTDETEEIALHWVNKDDRFRYYSKQNEGLGKTRNFAINKSCGTLILPLDSDNQLEEDFVENAISIFESNRNIGVVYGHAQYFGKKNEFWKVEEYKLEKILIENYIDACAIYKKVLWQQVGGYDENMPYQGLEDWELWIAFGVINVNFFHLNKITFKYYLSENSMIRSFTNEMTLLSRDYIIKKYSKLYHCHLSKSISENKVLYEKMKSKKFVINLFTKMFFGFKFFKSI
ncbi:glycosyltransferase family 2 protein [Flavobacterium yafengii]|uniref:glycosyltransferase family 2 protein n=1 Tax=Flavobacterium yafengii TaxID=3041253 RepID=UPI0024A820D8|nr:glycosyltransferase family 2 protein [Flavobacterium yafengii]MDI5887395.1 glycosyltransferase family 2 protein [Flavobacterium yafengii]